MKSDDIDGYLSRIPPGNGFEPFFREHGLSYRWIAMGSVVLGNLVAMLAVTMINVAIPSVMGAFGVGQDQAQWLATCNLAASTVSMLVCSWFCNRFGLRNLMLTAMGLFLCGSLLGGVANTFELMIVARIMQGITAGLLMPMAMTIVFQLFPPGKQGLAMGISAFGIILAPALGPSIGGVLVDSLNWRYIFLLGVPISLLAVPLALSYLPERVPGPTKPFDFIGFTLLTIALTALLIAITNGQRFGWDSNYVLTSVAAALLSSTAFIYSQKKLSAPLIEVDLFRDPKFTIMSVFAFAFTAGMFGSTYLLPLMIQMVQHQPPTDAGLLLMPAGLAMAFMFPITGRLSDSVPHEVLIAIGTCLFALSFWLLAGADEYTGYWTLAFWVILTRLAIGLVNTPVQISALAGIEPRRLAEASGLFNFMRQVGGAFGVNGVAQYLEYRRLYHTDYLVSTQTWDNSFTLEALYLFKGASHRFGMEGNDQWAFAFQALSGTLQLQALVSAFKDAFLVLAVAFLVLLLPLWQLRGVSRVTAHAR